MQSGIRLPEAARRLGVSPRTAARMIADGTLGSVRLRGTRVVPVSEVERLLAVRSDEEGDGRHRPEAS